MKQTNMEGNRSMTFVKKILIKIISFRIERINRNNRARLTNTSPTLICPSCIGGFIYHWLGLQFRSPFINLFMENDDFITAMENFDEFFASPLVEDKSGLYEYPVGLGAHGERIHFLHYRDFATAVEAWDRRKARIDKSNMAVILSNLGCGIEGKGKSREEVYRGKAAAVERFNRLPFKNKLVFSDEDIKLPGVVYFKHYKSYPQYDLFRLDRRSFLRRYIDRFDYVGFINSLGA